MKTEQEIKKKRDRLLFYVTDIQDESIIMSSQQKARIMAKVAVLNWVLEEDEETRIGLKGLENMRRARA